MSDLRPAGPLSGAAIPDVWDALARWRAEGRRFALATVIDSRGFTPRKPGTHMLIAEDGATAGTIGGGAIERQVMEEARALLEAGGTALVKKHLTQELGMCCGGEMAVFLEVLGPVPRLFLFGAGYIGCALARLATDCGFAVTVIDERPEWAVAERFARAQIVCRSPVDYLREVETTPSDYAVVVTHDHGLDQRLVQDLLRRPLKFLGLVGSIPKQRKFALRLRARGFSDAEIARVRCPLGIAIGAQTPEEIAVSAMGEIIAARRGASLAPSWTPPATRARAGDAHPSATGSDSLPELSSEKAT